jgi:hypothetical protein
MVDDLHPMSRRGEDMRRRRPLLVRVFDDDERARRSSRAATRSIQVLLLVGATCAAKRPSSGPQALLRTSGWA